MNEMEANSAHPDPTDRLMLVRRVSVRAVLVADEGDARAALAEAGLRDSVAIPVMIGDEPGLASGVGPVSALSGVLEFMPDEDQI